MTIQHMNDADILSLIAAKEAELLSLQSPPENRGRVRRAGGRAKGEKSPGRIIDLSTFDSGQTYVISFQTTPAKGYIFRNINEANKKAHEVFSDNNLVTISTYESRAVPVYKDDDIIGWKVSTPILINSRVISAKEHAAYLDGIEGEKLRFDPNHDEHAYFVKRSSAGTRRWMKNPSEFRAWDKSRTGQGLPLSKY